MDKLPNIHPGEVLLEEFLIPLNITRYRLAKAMAVSPVRINEICAGKRSITPDTALRLSRSLSTTPGFWLGLQADYDTEEVERSASDWLDKIESLVA